MFGSMNIINLVNIRSMRSRTGRTFMTGRRTRQLTRKLQNAVNSKMRVGWTYSLVSSLQGKWSQGGSPGPLPCPQWTIHSQSDSAAGYPHSTQISTWLVDVVSSSPLTLAQCPGGVKLAPSPSSNLSLGCCDSEVTLLMRKIARNADRTGSGTFDISYEGKNQF